METSVGVAIVLAEGGDRARVLLTRRSAHKRAFPGFWELPGGALEAGETPEDGIRREVREELGCEVDSLELLYVDCSEVGGRRHIVFVHQGAFHEDQLRLPSWEVSEYRLVHPLAPLPDELFPRVAEELQHYARAHGLTRLGATGSAATRSFDQKAAGWDQDFRVERTRLVAREITRRVPPPWGRVLDFGCGTGLLGWNFLVDAGSVTFADTSAGMLEQVARKLASGAPNGRILDLGPGNLGSGGDGPYDLVVSLQVLHHIDDVAAQIAALAGVLAPGGHLYLADLDAEDGSFHTDEVVPHQGFDRVFIHRAFEAVGLRVVSSTTPYVNRKVIGGVERLYPVFLVVGRR